MKILAFFACGRVDDLGEDDFNLGLAATAYLLVTERVQRPKIPAFYVLQRDPVDGSGTYSATFEVYDPDSKLLDSVTKAIEFDEYGDVRKGYADLRLNAMPHGPYEFRMKLEKPEATASWRVKVHGRYQTNTHSQESQPNP